MKRLLFLLTLSILSMGVLHGEDCPDSFTKILQERHSGYAYDSEKKVPREILVQLAEAARLSPSSYNDQPWSYIFCDREATPESYEKIIKSLAEGNKAFALTAPVLIVVSADSSFAKNQKPNRHGQYDTGASAMSLVYRATSLGLMAHQMGGFNEEKIQAEFGISKNITPMAIIAIGYESANEAIPPKSRKPLSANFFWGAWGVGLTP